MAASHDRPRPLKGDPAEAPSETIERSGPAGLLFFPVERLRAGDGFSVSTGVRSFSNDVCSYSFCTKTVRSEARLTFTPAR